MLQGKTTVIDLNSLLSCGDILLSLGRSCITDEQPENSFFTDPRFYSKTSIQSLRQSLQRKLSNQIFLMLRPISDNGLRTANIQRKPKRYRNLFKSFTPKTLSLRLSWKSLSQQFSQCQREKRLANIPRFCTSFNFQGKTTLCKRRLRRYIKKYRLCFGLNRYRSMPVIVSMGSASQAQKCCKASYAYGLKRLYTHIYTHYKRCCARNDGLSNYTFRTAGYLCHGQRLHRFRNIIQFFKEQLFLYHSSKKQYSLLPQVFSSNRQDYRFAKRSNNKIDRAENFTTLSNTAKTNQFSRRRTATQFRFSDKQFSVRCFDSVPALQFALADRTFLQMDQTAFANKVFFRNFYQRCQNSNLDSDKCLCACSDTQKGIEAGAFTARNTPNSEYSAFRENLAKTSTYRKLLYFQRTTKL